jgi:hypothetical protein
LDKVLADGVPALDYVDAVANDTIYVVEKRTPALDYVEAEQCNADDVFVISFFGKKKKQMTFFIFSNSLKKKKCEKNFFFFKEFEEKITFFVF